MMKALQFASYGGGLFVLGVSVGDKDLFHLILGSAMFLFGVFYFIGE